MGNLSVAEVLPQLYIALAMQLFNLLLWIILEQKSMRHFPVRRTFYYVVVAVFFANLLSCAATFLRWTDLNAPVVFVSALQTLVYFSNALVTYAFSVFFIRFIASKKGKTATVPLFNRVLLLLLVITLAGWFLWAVPQMMRTGTFLAMEGILLVFAAWVVVIYYMVFCVVYLVMNRSLIMRKERRAIVAGMILTITCSVGQAFAGPLLQINYVGATMGLFLFYFNFFTDTAVPVREAAIQTPREHADPKRVETAGRVRKHSSVRLDFTVISAIMLVSYLVLGVFLYGRAQELFLTVAVCLLCFAVSIILLFFLEKNLSRKFRLLDAKIEELSFDAEGLQTIEGLENGDEFEMIAEHINEVFEKNIKREESLAEEKEKASAAAAEEAEKLKAEAQAEAEKLRSAMSEVERRAEEKIAFHAAQAEANAAALLSRAGSASAERTVTPVPVREDSASARAQAEAGVLLPEIEDGLTKEEAIRRVRAATPAIMASYRGLIEALQPYFGEPEQESDAEADTDLPEMETEELQELYEAIAEFAEIYDADGIEKMLQQTAGFRVPEAEREKIARIRECVKNSDWNELKKSL